MVIRLFLSQIKASFPTSSIPCELVSNCTIYTSKEELPPFVGESLPMDRGRVIYTCPGLLLPIAKTQQQTCKRGVIFFSRSIIFKPDKVVRIHRQALVGTVIGPWAIPHVRFLPPKKVSVHNLQEDCVHQCRRIFFGL